MSGSNSAKKESEEAVLEPFKFLKVLNIEENDLSSVNANSPKTGAAKISFDKNLHDFNDEEAKMQEAREGC